MEEIGKLDISNLRCLEFEFIMDGVSLEKCYVRKNIWFLREVRKVGREYIFVWNRW